MEPMLKNLVKPSSNVYQSAGKICGEVYYQLRTINGLKRIYLPWVIEDHEPTEIFNNYCFSLLLLKLMIHFYWIIPACLFLSFLFFLPPILRVRSTKKMMIKCGYSYKYTCTKIKFSGPMGIRHVSLLKFVLYCYHLPNITYACINKTFILGDHTLFSVNAYPDELLCLSNGHQIKFPQSTYKFPLIESYLTNDWYHNRSQTWSCAGGTCPEEL